MSEYLPFWNRVLEWRLYRLKAAICLLLDRTRQPYEVDRLNANFYFGVGHWGESADPDSNVALSLLVGRGLIRSWWIVATDSEYWFVD